MARITVEDCLEVIDNQYDLVLLAKERTTQLNSGSSPLVSEDNDKRTIISLREIGDKKIEIDELEKSAILRLRKEPDESFEQEEDEDTSIVNAINRLEIADESIDTLEDDTPNPLVDLITVADVPVADIVVSTSAFIATSPCAAIA